jgi:hypothetical protein
MAENTVIFDADGDLRLIVGNELDSTEQCEFIVCSRTLSRATSVFKAMLYGPFKEAKRTTTAKSEWVVELPEDKATPLKLLFHIIHAKFEQVPQTLTLFELYEIAVMSNKYDMTRILRPWAKNWFEPHAKSYKADDRELLLWVAWELGAEDVFEKAAKEITLECKVDLECQLVDSQGIKLYDHLPAGIVGKFQSNVPFTSSEDSVF